MWVEELSNGKFKYVERYVDPLSGNFRKVSLTNAKRNNRVEKEMLLKLQEKIEAKTRTRTNTKVFTFAQLGKEYVELSKKRLRASTYQKNLTQLNTINATIGTIKLSHLTPVAVNQFLLSEFKEKGNAYETVNAKKKLINQILSHGIEFGYIADPTIVQRIKIQRLNTSEKKEWKYLERYELKEVTEYFKSRNMFEEARLCQVQAATGLRFNEMVALDYKKHIDFKNNKIFVFRNYDKDNKIFTLPKSGEERTIHINENTMEIIKEQMQFDQMKMMKSNLDRQNTLLFRTRYDNPYPLKAMNKKLDRIKLDSEKHVTTHIFRHTFITMMVEAGVDPKLIAEHVGHSSTKMIESVYSHFTEKMDKKMRQAILNVEIV